MSTLTRYWKGSYQVVSYDGFDKEIVGSRNTVAFSSPTRTWDDSKIGANNPNWRRQVRKHEQATTPYTRSAMSIRVNPGTVQGRYEVGGGVETDIVVKGDLCFPSSMAYFSPIVVKDLSTAVYLKWLKKAQSELRTSQGLVSLGELRETIHAIRHPLESLKKGFADYIRAVPTEARRRISRTSAKSVKKRAKAVAQAVSGTYLEYANGWGPLVSEIDSTSRTLAEHFAAPGVSYRRVEAVESQSETFSSKQVTAFETSGHPFAQWRRFQHVHKTSSVKIVGEVVVAHNGDPGRLMEASGFSLENFVPTVYELIPLSYVADYFWNMGDILEAFSFISGNRAWWSRSSVNKSEGSVSGSLVPVQPGIITRSGSVGSCEIRGTSMVRDDPGTTSIGLEFKLPGSHLFSKLANVASLGVQSFTASKLLNRLIHG